VAATLRQLNNATSAIQRLVRICLTAPVDVLVGQGMVRVDAIRQVSITEETYYRWRKQYGGMGTDQLKELKKVQKDNEQLRRAVTR
jgi:transposase